VLDDVETFVKGRIGGGKASGTSRSGQSQAVVGVRPLMTAHAPQAKCRGCFDVPAFRPA
jgi:hypothetical protein